MENLGTMIAICRTLCHSLWEGALFAVAGAMVIQLTKRSGAALRYQLLSSLLIIFILTIGSTFVFELRSISTPDDHPALLTGNWFLGRNWSPALPGKRVGFGLTGFLDQNARVIVCIWLLVAALRSLWLLGVLAFTHFKCKRSARPATEFWQQRSKQLADRLRVSKPVTLLGSAFIQVPVVYGHFKPLIFVPLGLLTQLPPEQAEAILLHELAHIRRNDYLVNVLQHIVEALLFFNPALLWLSGRIRAERENCCDDIAVAQTRDRKQYIAALIGFREFQANSLPAFTGSGGLVHRVRRIALQQDPGFGRSEKSAFAGLFMLAAVLLLFWSPPIKGTFTNVRHHQTYTRLEPMIADVTADLVNEQVIADPAALVSFELSNRGLTVNGIPQPRGLQERLRQKYLEDPPAAIDRRQVADPHFGLYYNARTGFTGMGVRN